MKALKSWFNSYLNLTRISLERGSEMIRIGGGLHKGNWFIRVDLWRVAYRLTSADPIVVWVNNKPVRQSEYPE